MAEHDDPSLPTPQHRPILASTPPLLATSDSAVPPGSASPPSSALTLEEAIEAVRIQLMEGRAMLHCLSEVLLYADDPDSIIHAEVAQAIARWITDASEQLDPVKLRPLIDAIRRRNNEPEGGLGNYRPYHQVREPSAVYYV